MLPSRTYHNTTSFLDVILNTLVGFVLLFLVAFVLIRPLEDKSTQTNAEFIITVTWDAYSLDDVDTWVQDPLGNILYFSNKETEIAHLDRDDLGQTNDSYTNRDGELVTHYSNQETVTIRGFIEGEWVVNVHMYKKKDDKPTNVIIVVDKLNPFQNIVRKHFIMKEHWEEKTAVRFQMSSKGEVNQYKNDFTYKKLVETKSISNPGSGTSNHPTASP